MDTLNGTSNLVDKTITRWLIAGSMMLLGACDQATDDLWALDDVHPRSASAPATVETVAAGDGHTWAMMSDGTLQGWGSPYCEPDGCPVPAQIDPLVLHDAVVEIHANGDRVLARLADGTVFTWTADTPSISPSLVTPGHSAPVTQLALGSDFWCARFDDGRIDCEGFGTNPIPTSPNGTLVDAGAVDLTAGASHACAVLETGAVQCWGDDTHGQLGASSPNGNPVAPSDSASRVVAGKHHTCVLLDSGAVQCWGRNDQGQLGDSGSGVITVPLGASALQITAGAEHGCAITAPDHGLYCWGNDGLEPTGSENPEDGPRPIELAGLGAQAIVSGPSARTTFALLDDGGLRSWGDNDEGQLGYGDDDDPLTPGLTVEDRWQMAVGKLPDVIIYDGEDA